MKAGISCAGPSVWCAVRQMSNVVTEVTVDLCIVGAGYCGLNALTASAHYLPLGSRVAIVDRYHRWGGTFLHAYEFVRLHQNYPTFTPGEREWTINKPPEHLATRYEILQHYEDCVATAAREKDLQIVPFFGVSWDGNYDERSGAVQLHVTYPVSPSYYSDASPRFDVRIITDRLIDARAFDILPKRGLLLGGTAPFRIHSWSPGEALGPNAALMTYGCGDSDIYVVGSGKTAMDTIMSLARLGSGVTDRVRCITGRGTCFVNRDLGPDEIGVRMVQSLQLFFEKELSSSEVVRQCLENGMLVSAIQDPKSCVLGVISDVEELSVVRRVLSPAHTKQIKAHVVSISNGCMELRRVEDSRVYTLPLREGTVIINCTDNFGTAIGAHLPILSPGGLVLAPQSACGFSGMSGDILTHLWFMKRLSAEVLSSIPRMPMMFNDKSDAWLRFMSGTLLTAPALLRLLPPEIARTRRYMRPLKLRGGGKILMELFPKCQRRFPERYTDGNVFAKVQSKL